ncbi:hypothetical protein [Solirubrum puertoriconensis]|uniref:Lipoprotein n=1 Tax=Solirubrum puertoriconensis TaxID=1751427 RepID=A0A9X0L4I5_SOLP1|nr:hypothetical protein [Solirubrum puertoriconensis]KUG07492.1 hypothetical protein ASU33_14195 [Solirubrum puertoriconensis]
MQKLVLLLTSLAFTACSINLPTPAPQPKPTPAPVPKTHTVMLSTLVMSEGDASQLPLEDPLVTVSVRRVVPTAGGGFELKPAELILPPVAVKSYVRNFNLPTIETYDGAPMPVLISEVTVKTAPPQGNGLGYRVTGSYTVDGTVSSNMPAVYYMAGVAAAAGTPLSYKTEYPIRHQ